MIFGPKIIENFFNTDQVNFLKSLQASQEQDNFLEPFNGRISKGIDINSLREDILEVIFDSLKNITDTEFVPTDWGFTRYENKYGKPILHPHVDGNKTEIIVDYQLETNIDWPIYIGGDKYCLKDNNAAIFSGSEIPHWRPNIEFKDGDFVTMIFFHFVTRSFFEKNEEEQSNLILKRLEKKEEIFNKYEEKWKNS
jgi:hypothetical protein